MAAVNAAAAGGAPDTRLRYVDALRAIAALLVLWLHVGDSFVHLNGAAPLPGAWLQSLASSVDLGRVGVVAFFLISGFVIPFSIHPAQPAPVRTFLVKRFLRIFPAYWLSIPFGALTGWWLWGRPFGVADFLVNLTLLQDLFGMRAAQGLYWTLLVEVVFYVLCVGLLLTRSLDRPRRLLALAAVFGGVHSLALVTHWLGRPLMGTVAAFWFLNLSIMLCGTLYRRLLLDDGLQRDRLARAGTLALFAYYLVLLPVAAVWATGFARNAAVAYALGMLLFVVGTRFVRIQTRLTDWLGEISYSIYLFHPVVFMTLLWLLSRQPAGSWWRTQHLGVYIAVVAVLTVGVATLVFRWIERPCIRLGHRLARALQQRAGNVPCVASAGEIARAPLVAVDSAVPRSS
jgi:peptidoglycan/LPS O-acetylase OafA/YrhL